ncbi:3-keto-disaccharide hydrolase [Flavihumibacter sp. UBA7668]|uniref:3-keto-disaccharide hydrolase n=1 Tax=Flavihumibacter sp. UBA7668 TaxID=1946542 RepID=UPI0025BD9A3F|nr:DUF1080 domain-containing protein [Flavihumibacter sp. UBA7668]
MKKQFFLASIAFIGSFSACVAQGDPKLSEQWKPVPPVINSGSTTQAPSDAIILFDGKNSSEWVSAKDGTSPAAWTVENGILTVKAGTGDIKTKQSFEDFQLHVEWRTPAKVEGDGQGRGNSGIFLMEQYELQVLDSYGSTTYSNGQAGSIYKQTMPLVNACKGPGEWQTYDIIFTAPRFHDNGMLKSPARITVLHNNVLVQNNTTIAGATEYIGLATYKKHGPLGIKLQDHGNPVSFRNIWLRKL